MNDTNNCKNIRILHLFPKLLSLYGEYGNVRIIEKYLVENGYNVEVSECEFPSNDTINDFDLYYIGSGTEANILEAIKRLSPIGDTLKKLYEANKFFFVTGNAMSLFGKYIEIKNNRHDTLGFFPYTVKMYTDKRFSGDILTNSDNIFSEKLIGYINTSCEYSGICGGLCELLLNPELGNDKTDGGKLDGFMQNNFLATEFIGPFAVKNPCVMKFICEKITGCTLPLDMTSDQGQAYKRAVAALEARLEKSV